MSQSQQQQQHYHSKQRLLQQQHQQQQQQLRWHYAHMGNNDLNMFAGGGASASSSAPSSSSAAASSAQYRGGMNVGGGGGNGNINESGRRNFCDSNMGYDLEMSGRSSAYYGGFPQNQLQRQQQQQQAIHMSRRQQQQQHHVHQQQQQQYIHHFQHEQQSQQHNQRQRHNQLQAPIKMEPLDPIEEMLTPTIEMEELIIKSEPPDEQAYNNFLRNSHQHQQQQQQQHQQLQQQQTLPSMASTSRKSMSSSSSTSLSSSALPSTSSVNTNYSQIYPQVNIKEEFPRPPEQPQPKPLNFPRLKVQTERSDTLPICQRCKQVFLKKHSYIRHVAQSTCDIVEYDFKCDVCSMSFMSNEELMAHEQLHRLNKFFCHKYCGKYFDSIESCEMHEFQHHEYATYVCNICSATFPNRELLFSHMPQHRQQPRFDCPVCRLWFQTPLELHQHRIVSPYFCGKYYDGTVRSSEFRSPALHTSPPRGRLISPDSRPMSSNSASIVQGVPRRYFPNTPATTSHSSRPHSQERSMMNAMHSRNSTVVSNTSSSLPRIKTEIKVEPDLMFTPNQYSQHSTSRSSMQQQQRFSNDYTDDSFSNASHSFSNDFSDLSSNFGSTTKLSRAEAIDDFEDPICCVPQCGTRKSTSPSLQFFGFPRDEKYMHQWLHNLKMLHHSSDISFDDLRICSLHFPKRCINRYSLCYWAVPTFNLGHDDVATLYQNREITNCFTTGENARCSMPGCNNQRGECNLKFYNFPREVKMLIKWCQNARLPVHTKEPRHFCSRHFEDRCFGKFRLKPWAVPTLHLGTPYGRIHDNPSVLVLEEKKCCLAHCKRTRSSDFNLSLYRFPRDETLLRRWCYNLRLDPDVYRGKNHKICSSHFIKEVLGLRKLSAGAVPTLNLGHNDTFNYYENELYSVPPPPPPSKSYTFHNSSMGNSGNSSVSHYASVSLSSSPTNFSSASSEPRPNSSSTNLMDFADFCCVPGCNSARNTENITLHTIPRRTEQMLKWCHNLKMDAAQIHKGLRICNLHFEPYCIGGCMRPFAVPTLNLGHEDTDIYKNPEVIKKLNIRETCCVAQCKRNRDRDRANLHRFPSKAEMLAKWCANLKKPVPDGTRLFNDAICEVHFEDRCLRNKRLEKWAVPTLNLGHSDIAYNLPTEEEVAEIWARQNVPPANTGDEEGECCVESCKRNPEIDDIKLYRMPDKLEVLSKWAHNLQMEVGELPFKRICNLHFEPRCIGKRLHSWAMPTMNLGKNVQDLHQNPLHHMMVFKKGKSHYKYEKTMDYSPIVDPNIPKVPWAPRCCLAHCRNRRGVNNVQLFRIPHGNRSMLAKWCHNLQIPLTQTKPRRVCSVHFEPHVLTKRCPMPQAVPTLELNSPPGYKLYQNPSRLTAVKMSVQTVCSVPNCRKTRGDGVQLFRLPLKGPQLRKWAHNLRLWEGNRLPQISIRAQMRICSAHFEPHSFGAKRLVPGAIPTLNVGHENLEDLYPNEAQPFSEIQCIVQGCNAVKDADNCVRLFKFPCDDEDLLWKWCNNLKMNPIDCPGVRICNKHFEEDCMGPKNLYKWAIPTIELGHNDSDIELIANPKPEDRYSEVIAKCCVPTCGKTRKYDEAQLNSFPKNPRNFRRWKHNLKLESLDFKKRDQYKICNDHFEEMCLGKNRLKHGAIPTVNLGHDDTDDLYKVKPEDMHYVLFGKMMPIADKNISGECEDGESFENDPAAVGESGNSLEVENKCSYPDCAASKTVLRECYEIPNDDKVLKALVDFINVPEESLSAQQKLCGLHFIEAYEGTKEILFANDEDNENSEETMSKLSQFTQTYNRACNSLTIRSAHCSVPGCKTNQLNTEYRLYPFPYNRELIEKWTQNTLVEVDEHRRYLQKVCGRHFESYCLTDTQRLRPWAIPTLNLNREDIDPTELHQNPDLNSVERRMLGRITYKCCVADCGRERTDDNNAKLFNFPTDEVLLDKWTHNLQLPREKCPLYKICEEHFEPYCVGYSRVRSWAIPTLKLGYDANDAIEIYKNPKKAVQKYTGTANNEAMDISDAEEEDVDEESDDEEESLAVANVKIKKSLDILKCCLSGCRKSRLKHGVSLYAFPSNTVMFKKWCHNLQLSASNVRKQTRVCNLHFIKRCIDGKQLRSWAVPTIHLGHNANIYQIPKKDLGFSGGVFTNSHYCAVPNCSNHNVLNTRMRMIAFPTDKETLKKWCENLNLDSDADYSNQRICLLKHFEKAVRVHGELLTDAVPTENLGHDEAIKYTNADIIMPTDETEMELSIKESTKKSFSTTSDSPDPLDISNETSESCVDSSPLKPIGIKIMTTPPKLVLQSPSSPDKKIRVPNNVAPICCLKHCRKEKTASQHLTTFGFPKDPNVLLKWCDNLQLNPEDCIGRVCIEHFELRVLGNRRLKPGAVPTLNVGHDEPLKHTNNPSTCNQTTLQSLQKQDMMDIDDQPETTSPNSSAATTSTAKQHESDNNSDTTEDYYTEKLEHSVFRLCCLKHCRRKRRRREKLLDTPNEKVRVFKFPRDASLLKMWAHNLRLPLEVCRSQKKRMRLCEAHFEEDFKDKWRLKTGAVPTLDLGYDATEERMDLFKSVTPAVKDEIKKPAGCCIAGCTPNEEEQQTAGSLKLFSFPKRGPILRKWAHNTGHDAYTAQQDDYQICERHFELDCFDANNGLKSGAVPTLELGSEHNEIFMSELNENPTMNSMGVVEQHNPKEVTCCIPNCGGLKGQYIVSHFPFPADEDHLQKWCHNLRLQPEKCRGAYICSLHFAAGCIRKRILNKLAVPTENLGFNLEQSEDSKTEKVYELYKNPAEVFETNHQQPVTRCCVHGCNKSKRTDGVRLYQFPKLRSQHLKWAHNLGLRLSSRVINNYKVCELHFEPSCIRNKRLLFGAIPTLALGLDESIDKAQSQTQTPMYTNSDKLAADGKIESTKHRKRLGGLFKTTLKCAMRGCNLVRSSAVALVSMPRADEQLKNKWLDYAQLNAKSVIAPKLCALHFIAAYRQLCANESVKTENTEPDMDESQAPAASELTKLRMRYENLMNSARLKQLMCSVPGCNITYVDNITFHQLPKEQSLNEKWQHNTQAVVEPQRRYATKVCALHFEERCFGAKRLRGWAIPTLRLPPHKGEVFENPKEEDLTSSLVGVKLEESLDEHNNTQNALCCVENCGSIEVKVEPNDPDTSSSERREYWTLPINEPEALQKWCHNLGITETNVRALRKLRVCSRHFHAYCFSEKYRLRSWALPTLELPPQVENVYENPVGIVVVNMCCIPTCRQVRDTNAGIHLYAFPQSNESYFEKWVHNVRLDPEVCRKAQICTLHFEKHMLNCRNLVKGALPTLDLGHNELEIFHNPKKVKKQKKHRNPGVQSAEENSIGSVAINNDKPENSGGTQPAATASKCCMSACKAESPVENESVSKVALFNFPKVDWLLQKWCDNTQKKLDDARQLLICDRHFEPHTTIGRLKPRPLAVPTLLLDGNSGPIHENPKQLNKYHPEEKESGEVKFVRGNCCAIISCLNSKADGVRLYKYPHRGPLLRKWAENCKHHAYQAARYNFRICNVHFEDDCFASNDRLRYGAVPTLQLGYDINEPTSSNKLHCSEFQQLSRKSKCKKLTTALHETTVENKCGVPNCGRTKLNDNVRLFKFPDDEEMLTKWCHNLHLQRNECKDLHICNMHFEARCINQRRIFKRAVPTLLLGHSNIGGGDIIENPEVLQARESFIYCFVPGCGNIKTDDSPDTFSAFPKTRSLFEKWTHNINVSPTNDLWHNSYKKVCSKHFESYCYEHGRLKYGAIPTLNLGHENLENIHTITEEDVSFKHKRKRDNISSLSADIATELICAYSDCKEVEKGKARQVFQIPQGPLSLQQAWLKSIKVEGEKAEEESVEDQSDLKLCPVHFKLVYDENVALLNDLRVSDSLTEKENKYLKDLEDIDATVSQISRVRSLMCAVEGCTTNMFNPTASSPTRLYSLPINRELSAKWCVNANIMAEEDHRYAIKICGLHFEDQCFLEVSRRLKSWALPTLKLPNAEDREIILNPVADSTERKGIAAESLRCCIQTCTNAKEKGSTTSNDDMKLFSFPREIPLLKKWLHNTGIAKRDVYKARICVLHFEKHCFNIRLRSWAIPTLLLDSEKTDLYQNPIIKRLMRAEKLKLDSKFECESIDSTIDDGDGSRMSMNISESNTPTIDDFDEEIQKPKLRRVDEDSVSTCSKSEVDYNLNINKSTMEKSAKKVPPTKNRKVNYAPSQDLNPNDSIPCIVNLKTEFNEIQPMKTVYTDSNPPPFKFKVIDVKSGFENQCCLPHCQNQARPGKVQLFKFPESTEQLDKWLHNLTLDYDTKQPWKYLVCSAHFEKSCFDRSSKGIEGKLFKWATPTLNLGDNAPSLLFTSTDDFKKESAENTSDIEETENSLLDVIYEEELSNMAPTSSNSSTPTTALINSSSVVTSYKRCCIPHCQQYRSETVKLFHFPTIHENAVLWQRVLGMTLNDKELRTKLVCSLHFEPCLVGVQRLTRQAVPTVNIHPPPLPTVQMLPSPPIRFSNVQKAKAIVQPLIRPEPCKPQREKDINGIIQCSVPFCGQTTATVEKIYSKFPDDFEIFTKWCFNLRIDPRKFVEGQYHVCILHFANSCIIHNNELHEKAVPTLELGHNGEIHRQDLNPFSELAESPLSTREKLELIVHKKRLQGQGHNFHNITNCCANGCTNRRNLFDFPRNPSLHHQWCHNLNIDEDGDGMKICQKHFHKSCIRNERLHPEALPTLHLGHAGTSIYPNRGSYKNATSTIAVNESVSAEVVSSYYNEIIPDESHDTVVVLDDDDDDEDNDDDVNEVDIDDGNIPIYNDDDDDDDDQNEAVAQW